MGKMISIELAFALPGEQAIIPLKVAEGTTVHEAAVQSGIASRLSQIDLDLNPMGIFGKEVKEPRHQLVRHGDRIEIYRPLILDVRVERKKRVNRKRAEN